MGTFLFESRIFSLHENGQRGEPVRLPGSVLIWVVAVALCIDIVFWVPRIDYR